MTHPDDYAPTDVLPDPRFINGVIVHRDPDVWRFEEAGDPRTMIYRSPLIGPGFPGQNRMFSLWDRLDPCHIANRGEQSFAEWEAYAVDDLLMTMAEDLVPFCSVPECVGDGVVPVRINCRERLFGAVRTHGFLCPAHHWDLLHGFDRDRLSEVPGWVRREPVLCSVLFSGGWLGEVFPPTPDRRRLPLIETFHTSHQWMG